MSLLNSYQKVLRTPSSHGISIGRERDPTIVATENNVFKKMQLATKTDTGVSIPLTPTASITTVSVEQAIAELIQLEKSMDIERK
jgi:hypothetical protein